jgi:thiamine monophosphate kinase
LDLPLTRIGHLAAGQGLSVQDSEGREIALPAGGWTHF